MPTANSVPLLRWPILAAVAALVVAWVGFAALRAGHATPEPPWLNRNVVASFWSVPVTGGRPRLLFRTRGWQDSFPAYRRDGSLLFVRPTESGQMLVGRTTDGRLRRLRTLPEFTQVVYSPATDEILVWNGMTLAAESLFGKQRRVLATRGTSMGVWSPDGSAFAFARQLRQRSRPELVVVRDRLEHVFRLDAGVPVPLALSPTGDRLLFSWGVQLFLLNTHTGSRRLFANGGSTYAAWSPDGHTIAYLDEDGLVTRDVRTNRRKVLVPRPRTGWASFSPDGRKLLYVTQQPK